MNDEVSEQQEADLGQAEMDEIRDQRDDEIQAELEERWAKRRAEESAQLTANEAANYARHHATIERDDDGNIITVDPNQIEE